MYKTGAYLTVNILQDIALKLQKYPNEIVSWAIFSTENISILTQIGHKGGNIITLIEHTRPILHTTVKKDEKWKWCLSASPRAKNNGRKDYQCYKQFWYI